MHVSMAGGEQQLGEQHARIGKILWDVCKERGVRDQLMIRQEMPTPYQ